MIPLKFGLFWSGSKLSYLRYMTFATLRHFHPTAPIQLYVSKTCSNEIPKWNCERQDFQSYNGKCYMENLKELNVEIIEQDWFSDFLPNFQSDLFRWWWMQNGGWYLDTDQIVLKPLSEELLNKDFVYSMYMAKSCGVYAPVGVLGSSINNNVVKHVLKYIMDYYNKDDYNSIGPFMLRDIMKNYSKMVDYNNSGENVFNAPSYYFYPIAESFLVDVLYKSNVNISDSSYCLHWYGGSPVSQQFNNSFTEEFMMSSNDTISSILKNIFLEKK